MLAFQRLDEVDDRPVGGRDVERVGGRAIAEERAGERPDLARRHGGEVGDGLPGAPRPGKREPVMRDVGRVEPARLGERVEEGDPLRPHRPERRDLRGHAGDDGNADLVLHPAHGVREPVMAERQVQRHAAEHHDVDPGAPHLARRLQRHRDAPRGLLLRQPPDRERGQHQRHPVRHQPVELVRESLGEIGRRGVADPGAMSVHGDPLSGP